MQNHFYKYLSNDAMLKNKNLGWSYHQSISNCTLVLPHTPFCKVCSIVYRRIVSVQVSKIEFKLGKNEFEGIDCLKCQWKPAIKF